MELSRSRLSDRPVVRSGRLLAGLVLFGGSISLLLVGMVTLLQRQTPPALIGRADAALNFLLTVPQTLAIAAGAALIVAIDYRLLLLGMAVLCFAGAALLVGQRQPALAEAAR